MKRIKRILIAVTLIVALAVPSCVFAAGDADSPTDFGETTVVASNTSKVYNGKKPSFWVYVITEGNITKKVQVTGPSANAGTYKILVPGTDQYVTYTSSKAKGNSVKSAVSYKKYSYKKLRKRSYSFRIGASAVKSGSVLSYKSSSKYVTVNKYGKVTVKKRAKKGTYKVAVTATNGNYTTVVKYITVRVR